MPKKTSATNGAPPPEAKPLTPGRALDRVIRIMAGKPERVKAAVAKVHTQTQKRIEAVLEQLPDEADRALIRDRYGLQAPGDEPTFADEDVETDDEDAPPLPAWTNEPPKGDRPIAVERK